jgi:hypothetical protein
MTPREARLLLGGYATGTLTEAERRALFAAALEDQELFDTLADEEALRELLADPDVRSRLLAILTGPARRPPIPFWRRPGAMGVAASLLVAVGVGLLLRHGPAATIPATPVPERAEAEPRSAPPAKSTTPQAPAEAMKRRQQADLSPRLDRAPIAAGAAPVAGFMPTAENQAIPAPAREKAEAKRAAEPSAAPAPSPAPEGVAGAFAYSQATVQEASQKLTPPVWSLERAPPGAFRLSVRWGPGGHLYLLRREASGVSVLSPVSSATLDGKTESLFSGPLGAESALDLYLLPEAASVPASLPAGGPLPGFRARIWPPAEKTP